MDEKKEDSEQENGEEDLSHNDQHIQNELKKLKVKQLKGSPYVISLEKKDIIGQGSFGLVVRAYDVTNIQEDLAAKIISFTDKSKLLSIQTELKVLQKLPFHQNLVNYKRIKMSSNQKQYLIMEYCNGGTLTDLIKTKKYLSEIEIIDFLQQFCRGYRVLYNSGIIHRDIKPDNILIHNKIYKIADFGLAKVVDHFKDKLELSIRGTPLYMAPELIKKQLTASAKVDMWSLGVILYRMMYHGRYPFLDSHENYDIPRAFRDILSKNLHIPTSVQRNSDLIEICKRMLEKDDKYRISWEDLFSHPIISPAMIEEDSPNINNLDQIKSKLLLHSSVFLKRYEIMKISKIKVQTLDQQKAQEISYQNTGSINGQNNQQQQSNQQQQQNQQIPQQQKYEINNKLLENIIFTSNKRVKEGIITNQIEDILLMHRELILFFDKLALRLSRLQQLLTISDSQLLDIINKLEIIIFKMALNVNKALLDDKNIQKYFKLTMDDWNIYKFSEKFQLTQQIFNEDKFYLEDNYTSVIANQPNKNSYYIKLCNLTEQQLQQEFYNYFQHFKKSFNQFFFPIKQQNNKKAFLICCQYLLDSIEFIQQNPNSQIKNFTIFTDFLGYYDKYEFDYNEQVLFEEVNKKMIQLNND